MRIVCQFSCGAASAVATKLAIAQYGDCCVIINAYLAGEHADNRRFLADCEAWFERKVLILRDEKYGADPIEVFRRTRYIKGRQGASCTKRLKRDLLRTFEQPGDVLVLGYTADEQWRPLLRDAMGFAWHPELALLDEGMKVKAFHAALGVEVRHTMAEDDLSMDEYDAMNDSVNWSKWAPKPPSGEAWNLVAIFNTEDGPAAWWMRELRTYQQGDAA